MTVPVRTCLWWLVCATPLAVGAERHWSYERAGAPRLPAIEDRDWPHNGIDTFILKRLTDRRLRPSASADRATLVRRVTLDLTGLPPTLAEVDAFLQDQAPGAYERVVDRLLRAPAYAERMTGWWLDMARYADTHGYEGDGARSIWLYRDWVIDAFLRGMSFDRFTVLQLAGDLLPGATDGQRIATGFHRNSPFCYEGGTDLEQFRVESVVDRVNTTMTVWMGTTFGCAQCHDHKYDPISQQDYFQLYAFFNNATEAQGASLSAVSPLREGLLQGVEQRVAALQRRIAATDYTDVQREYQRIRAASELRRLAPATFQSLHGATLERLPDGSVLASGENPTHDCYEVEHHWAGGRLSAVGLEVLHHASLPKGGPGRYEQNGNFGLSTLQAEVSLPGGKGAWQTVTFRHAIATHHDADDKVTHALHLNSACWCTNQQEGHAWFLVESPRDLPAGTRIKFRLLHNSKWDRHGLGRFRLWSAVPTSPEGVVDNDLTPLRVYAILATAPADRSAAEVTQLGDFFRAADPSLRPLRAEIEQLRSRLVKTATLVMQERAEPRTTRVLVAGSHLNPGQPVSADVPAIWHRWDKQSPRNRLGLAQWLVDPANPLVARVTMNRLWAMFFGRGIVTTSEDFGAQGKPPTHPQLLDHLATAFVRCGWNVQAMQRMIVTSATYRQTSAVDPDLLRIDPQNRWYARGAAFRLEAESIRDTALAASGLLDRRIGGAGVYPYQPPGVYEQIHSYTTAWETSSGGQQFRRGLYTWWKRTAPYPSMITFDAPRRNVCSERRPRTNTPLQALVTLNDPGFVQCAAALGRRMRTGIDGTSAQRVENGFRHCVGRHPEPAEVDELVKLYDRALRHYRQHGREAEKLATSGLSAPLPPGIAVEELAAWTLVANALLNLDETLMRY